MSDSYKVIFIAIIGELTISCFISRETLIESFHGDHLEPIEAFLGNRPEIQCIAERIIYFRRFEPDGSIMICTTDCQSSGGMSGTSI